MGDGATYGMIPDLKQKLMDVDNGRWRTFLVEFNLPDICAGCYFFNPLITDEGKGYRCHVMGHCIAATLHPKLQAYLLKSIGEID